jgi:hypothetical protein
MKAFISLFKLFFVLCLPIFGSIALAQPGPTVTISNAKYGRSCLDLLNGKLTPSFDLASMRPGAPHTIQNIPAYLDANIGEGSAHYFNKVDKFILIQGGPDQIGNFLNREGWEQVQVFNNPQGHHYTFLMRNKGGSLAMAFTRVNGLDRVEHIVGLLKMAGVGDSKILITGTRERYRERYRKLFQKQGYVPDLVIYGFPLSFLYHIISRIPDQSRRTNLLSQVSQIRKLKSARTGEWREHEMTNQSFIVLQMADGKKVWLFNNEYGDRAADLFEAFQSVGIKRTIFLGMAGSLNSELKVGDVVQPSLLYSKGQWQSPRLSLSPSLVKQVRYRHVTTPNVETIDWLNRNRTLGVDLVEVELQRVNDILNGKMEVEPLIVVSDVLVGPDKSDYSQWNLDGMKLFMRNAEPLFQPIFRNDFAPEKIEGFHHIPL